MNYSYDVIKPTRLYIKKCPHCDLKYFGKYTGKDIENYQGSGTHWKRHLAKHDVEPVHLWNSDWYHDTSITRFALKFSHINKIVENNTWANLKLEDGLAGGWDHVHNEGTQLKARANNENTMMTRYGVTCAFHLPHAIEARRSKDVWNKGKIGIHQHSAETKERMSVIASGRIMSDDTKDKIRNSVISHYNRAGALFLFIDGEHKEEIFCLKSWAMDKCLDYRKVFSYINKGPIKMIDRYDSQTRRWFIGKEIRRL